MCFLELTEIILAISTWSQVQVVQVLSIQQVCFLRCAVRKRLAGTTPFCPNISSMMQSDVRFLCDGTFSITTPARHGAQLAARVSWILISPCDSPNRPRNGVFKKNGLLT